MGQFLNCISDSSRIVLLTIQELSKAQCNNTDPFLSVICVITFIYCWYKFIAISQSLSHFKGDNMLKPPGDSILSIYSLIGIGSMGLCFLLNFKRIKKHLKENYYKSPEEAQKEFIEKELKRRAKKEQKQNNRKK